MTPVYDQSGNAVAWIKRPSIVDLQGEHVAMIHDVFVVSYRGRILGTFTQGWFRELDGRPVAFTTGALGFPTPPATTIPDVMPTPKPTPPMPVTPAPPPLRPPGRVWSERSWGEFLKGR